MKLSGHWLPDEPFTHREFSKGDQISPDEAMLLCFEVARGGLGRVSPNPLVGCVIVDRDHRLLSTGYHAKYGEAHAEQNAVDQLDAAELDQSTVYVSLEPCAHQGHTPPCAVKLSELPIKSVLYAIEDPNPKVDGKGAHILHKAGIECRKYPGFEELAWEQNAIFFMRQLKSKPLIVGLKAGMTLDAKIAEPGDQRAWITGARSRQLAHYLRLVYDAIIVGAETVIKDNPQLTPRHSQYGGRTPWRIVIDPSFRALRCRELSEQRLLQSAPEHVIWMANVEQRHAPVVQDLQNLGVSIRFMAMADGVIHPDQILAELSQFAIYSVMLEGGAGLYRTFLDHNLVDRMHLFIAPDKFYGAGGIPLYAGAQRLEMNPIHRFSYRVDGDILLDLLV